MEKVICVLVLYNPDYNITNQAINAIIPQIDTLFISDNSTISVFDKLPKVDNIVYQKMAGNVGIAAAQNVGIKYGINNGYKYLFFLDQDSVCPNDIITTLISEYTKLKGHGYKVGAIGPRAINRSTGKLYKGLINVGNLINDNITQVTELISSASFIELETFANVGYMDTSLFIDGVDHEWCWRASCIANYNFFISEKVLLSHQLGEGDRYFLWRKVAIPTPFRTYYQYRNYFILLRRPYVPNYWKLTNGIKYLIKLFYFPIFISPRIKYLKNICKGISDGILYKR